MNGEDFRAITLKLPGAEESAHMNHPDFRVGGKVFASLTTDETKASVMLTPEQQQEFMHDYPDAFSPAAGAWGRKGWTMILLSKAKRTAVDTAIQCAINNRR